jgi:hypothetical protein
MRHIRFHAVGKCWLLVRVTVIGAVLAGLVPLNGQQPQQPSGSATQDPFATSEPKQNPTSSPACSAKNDPNAEVTVQDSGTTFRDLSGGLSTVAAAPEVPYVLGFSPQNNKMDGSFHTIKVTITGKRKYSIQARRSYYAPRKVENPRELGREEIQDLPMQLQTQYLRTTDSSAVPLNVVSNLQMRGVHFRKAGGRNPDNLIVATTIFHENGNFVMVGQKTLEMKVQDATYQRLMQSELTAILSFGLRPGKYPVRQVIRDSEGSQMAARNGAVHIPNGGAGRALVGEDSDEK